MNNYLELHALYHHGIKGQKWGVRRFQNPDGTLTPEGLKRYGTSKFKEISTEEIKKDKQEYFMSLVFKGNKALKEAYDKATKDLEEANRLEEESQKLAEKYDFDQDDGGGGSTIEDETAGKRYMELQDKVMEIRQKHEDLFHEIMSTRNSEYKRLTNDYLLKKYGTLRMSILKKERAADIVTTALVVSPMIALIGGIFITGIKAMVSD